MCVWLFLLVPHATGQGAIAAKPSATYKGYLLGGLCWFAVPFTMATSMGLGARAMNLPISLDESNAGLVPPAVATVLMGAGGGFLLVFQVGGCWDWRKEGRCLLGVASIRIYGDSFSNGCWVLQG